MPFDLIRGSGNGEFYKLKVVLEKTKGLRDLTKQASYMRTGRHKGGEDVIVRLDRTIQDKRNWVLRVNLSPGFPD
ncbi:MAG: hypothetical protein Fur0020_05900 [Thermodesulfovibrionia bacterium]